MQKNWHDLSKYSKTQPLNFRILNLIFFSIPTLRTQAEKPLSAWSAPLFFFIFIFLKPAEAQTVKTKKNAHVGFT